MTHYLLVEKDPFTVCALSQAIKLPSGGTPARHWGSVGCFALAIGSGDHHKVIGAVVWARDQKSWASCGTAVLKAHRRKGLAREMWLALLRATTGKVFVNTVTTGGTHFVLSLPSKRVHLVEAA